ncbi:hypothetical protein VCHC17A1_4035B, partial [Vibrio cholerae HC-17A1]
HSVRNNESSLA